ncbi:MAG: glycosyl transferase group 1 [Acidobacteriaceae bacterium]|nr:glycosyl transferase group 1 [Acidobacteriaceae bacterium]
MSTQSIVLSNDTGAVKVDSVRVLIALEYHFLSRADGHIYTSAPPNYAFWRRYLGVFEEVVVLARVGQTTNPMPLDQRADGPGVTFQPLPDYTGPAEYLRKLVQLRSIIRKAVSNSDAYILRLPGSVGNLAAREIRRLGRGYAVEVVGDPWDVFSPGAIRTPLRPLYRRLSTRSLRRNCIEAVAASYVTRSTLQDRYPARAGAYVCGISDVLLGKNIADIRMIEKRKQRTRELTERLGGPVPLGFIGSLATNYKGVDTLLKAVAICQQGGLQVKAHLLGDGRSRPQFEDMARDLGISQYVQFHGQVPAGKAVFEFLDFIDIFVMPSRTEGLPRAMVEAMARGCPCIGSAVGGIPELLAPEALIPPSDERQLAAAIRRFVSNPDLSSRMIEHNVKVAQTFQPEALEEAQHRFLSEVRARSIAATQNAS